nr:ATP-binding cassette domain-containing protein [Lachnospiraceae bacterium]
MNNIVEMKNISKSYDGKRFVLKELDFCLQTGEIATIYGASGSGKSTLLNCMGFLDRFNEGEYRFNGQAIDVKRINNYTQYRASDIGFIFQAYSLI